MAETKRREGAAKDEARRERTERRGRPPPAAAEEPRVLEEIGVEELAIDGICGVY